MIILPPDEPVDAEPYDVVRGTCPRCGSHDVRHLLIGLQLGPGPEGGRPEWVTEVGCLHPGHDRECDRCGSAWSVRR